MIRIYCMKKLFSMKRKKRHVKKVLKRRDKKMRWAKTLKIVLANLLEPWYCAHDCERLFALPWIKNTTKARRLDRWLSS